MFPPAGGGRCARRQKGRRDDGHSNGTPGSGAVPGNGIHGACFDEGFVEEPAKVDEVLTLAARKRRCRTEERKPRRNAVYKQFR